MRAFTFGDIRPFLAINASLSVCQRDGSYENHCSPRDVPTSYDAQYVFGIGLVDSEFLVDELGFVQAERGEGSGLSLRPCIEVVLQDHPRTFGADEERACAEVDQGAREAASKRRDDVGEETLLPDGFWRFHDDACLGAAYAAAREPRFAANPFRWSGELERWIFRSGSGSYRDEACLAVLAEEYEPFCCLTYSYALVGDASQAHPSGFFLHAHSFDGVVKALVDDPVRFYVPRCCADEYSRQELDLLELLRARLCSEGGVVPEAAIVDAMVPEDEWFERGADEHGELLRRRIASLLGE